MYLRFLDGVVCKGSEKCFNVVPHGAKTCKFHSKTTDNEKNNFEMITKLSYEQEVMIAARAMERLEEFAGFIRSDKTADGHFPVVYIGKAKNFPLCVNN